MVSTRQVFQPEASGSSEGTEDHQRVTQGGAADGEEDPADPEGGGCHHQHQQGQESVLVRKVHVVRLIGKLSR